MGILTSIILVRIVLVCIGIGIQRDDVSIVFKVLCIDAIAAIPNAIGLRRMIAAVTDTLYFDLVIQQVRYLIRSGRIGDLGLTALNDLSRNRTLGMLIGKGFGFDPNTRSSTVVEGLRTVKLMGNITKEKGVAGDFPLVQALYRLLYEGESLNDYLVSVLD